MTPAIILDVLIAAILLTAILRGSWRGLFLSLSGVIVLILTIVGANLGAKALTPPVADWATPKIEENLLHQSTFRLKAFDLGDEHLLSHR